jgi:pimeloyl-ACP methyl ester carboxylesterase
MAAQALPHRGGAVELWRRGSGPPLLYLHGLADVHALSPDRTWRFLERLAESFDVVAPAHPGYVGTDEMGPDTTIEDYVFHEADLLDALGLEQVDVVGHSFGGWLAAELAVRRPDRVRRLVLVDPLGLHVRGVRAGLFFGAAAPVGLGGFSEVRAMLFGDGESEAARWALPEDMEREEQLRWFGGLAGAAKIGWKAPQLANPKLARHLWRVRAPVLLAVGTEDRIVTAEHVAAWEAGLDDARVERFTGAGHALPIEQPDALAERVLEFLRGD